MPTEAKFALYDFAGKPREFYLVNEIDVPKPVLEKSVTHHIVVVDRSGSMYGVMNDTKAMVEKVMTVEEFTQSGLLLTLISYSSKGDYTVHFARTSVADVLAPGSAHVEAIRGLRATCLTSVSGALDEALAHVQSGETTAISIHTDGYFNDVSPASEAKAVDKWIKRVQKDFPNVYANTVAYGNWTDFKMLDRIASSLSGKCVVAKNVKQVYEALHDTSALLAGRVLPAIHVPQEDADFLAFHNVTQRKVNGAATDFAVKGVGPDDATKLYRFKKVAETTWDRSKAPVASAADPATLTPVYVFARTLLGQQRLNDAKFALMATRDEALVKRHYKALTAEALAVLAEDIEARIGGNMDGYVETAGYGFGADKASVLDLCALLEKHRNDFTLDLPASLDGYTRRSVKRLFGRWNPDGTFAAATTKLVANDDENDVSVTAFDLSNAASTINMQVTRSADLYKDGEIVKKAAGRKLDVKQIRSYTLVGDGEVNMPRLALRISSKKLHGVLAGMGLVEGDFDPKRLAVIDLKNMPACSFASSVSQPTPGVFSELATLTIQRGILLACLGGSAKADEWTAEQLEELKAHDLTAALWYSPPTTNPYTDLTAAVSAGEIDTRTTYSVTLGDARMVSTKALYSANEYLARRFSVKKAGADAADCDKEGFLKKPKFTDIVAGATFTTKALSARTKLNAIDDLTYPLFERFLLGAGFEGVTAKSDASAISEALAKIEDRIEAIYAEALRPLAFYIGATGLVPEGWDVELLDAEGLEARFPGIDIEKKQRDGTFLVGKTGGSDAPVVGIFPEVAYYSTEKGVETAKALSSADADAA
jgi:hypothetical protein